MADGGRKKQRLDEILLLKGFAESLPEAEALIRAGRVHVGDHLADKPGLCYPIEAEIFVRQPPPFVSRGGMKLAGALDYFHINPNGWICADIGASTGGFTDCLLQYGAKQVFAVDVAYGQLHWRLRTDKRVVVIERLNVRNLTANHIPVPLDLAVFDISFNSLSKVIPPVLPLFGSTIKILALVKPQFELPRKQVGRGGIVQKEESRLEAVETIISFGKNHGLACAGYTESQITGAKGNKEYLVYFQGS